MAKEKLTQKKAENSPAGGVVVGERNGQTMIYDDASVGGYFVGKTHSKGGIKMVNKSTGQQLEVQGSEVIITAPAVNDNKKREFEGKMMTNRQILSKINSDGGGVSFAKGGDVPKNIKFSGASYKYGGKTMTDHEIYKHITGGHLAEGMTLPQIAKMHKVSVKELQKQVEMGMEAESEHTSSKREQMKIVKDHLYENPKYYTLLKRAGLEDGGNIESLYENENDYIKHLVQVNLADGVEEYKLQQYLKRKGLSTLGLLPDNVKKDPEYIKIKRDYDIAFKRLQNLPKFKYPKNRDRVQDFKDRKKAKEISDKIIQIKLKNESFEKAGLERGGILKIPNVNHTDLKGKEFTFQNGKFLIVDFPNKEGAWKKGANFRQTVKHFISVIKLDNINTDLDSLLFKKFKKPYFVYDDYFNQFENKPSLSLDGNYKKMIDTLNYQLKSYANGGHIQKQDLVKSAKSGNTTARDLNNYNDVLDMDADGMVGAETGLYARGGSLIYAKGGATDVTVNNWSEIPDEFKNIRLPKKINWNANPSDDGLNEILKPFLSKEPLRPAMGGINFDDNGITATNAHILLTIPTTDHEFQGIYKKEKLSSKSLQEVFPDGVIKIDAKYPNYEMVFPKQSDIKKVCYVDILKLLTYFKVAINYSDKKQIVFKIDGAEMSVTPDLMINFLTSLIKLGGNQYMYVSFQTNKKALIFSYYSNFALGKDVIGLMMPYIYGKEESYGAVNKEKKAELNVYFDFDDNEIRNADDSIVDLSIKPTKTRAKRTPKTTSSQTNKQISKTLTRDELRQSKIWIGDNLVLRDRVMEKLTQIGLPRDEEYGDKDLSETQNIYIKIFDRDFVVFTVDKKYFDEKNDINEIFPSDLGINIGVTPTATATTSGKFSSGDIDAFNQIDEIVKGYGITVVSTMNWSKGTSNTTDFDIVNTLTGDVFQLRRYNKSLGVQDDDIQKEKSRALIEDYNEWKKTQPSATASASASASKALSKADLDNIKIKINSDFDLALKIVEKLEQFGFSSTSGIRGEIKYKNEFYAIWHGTGNYVGWFDDEDDFNDSDKKELFASDLGISTATTSATPINAKNTIEVSRLTRNDLSNSKIWLGYNPELCEKIQKRAFELGLKWVDGDERVSELDALCLVFNGTGNQDNRMEKRPSKSMFESLNLKEIFVTDSTTTATPTSVPFDLKQKKIFVGDNPALSEKIQKRAFELGWFWETASNSVRKTNDKALFFFNDKSMLSGDESTFNSASLEEITEADLFGNATTMTSTPTALPIIDLSETKIWIGDNPALSEKIQKRAFELGWFWSITNKDKPLHTEATYLSFWDNNTIGWNDTDKDDFNKLEFKEIFVSDLFGTTPSQTSTLEDEIKNFDFSALFPSEKEDWVKKFTADLDKLVFGQDELEKAIVSDAVISAPKLSKEQKDLQALIKLLPSFQQSKYAIERAKILKEIKKLHNNLTYDGFIKPNEALSSESQLFTPQGLLDYYFTQTTQNPTSKLEEPCGLPTPNGGNSKLPLSAYLNVRTLQFKKWFGDWEMAYSTNNYVNCSKMIDQETKEPKIYFHGVRKYVPSFGQFSNMGQGVVRPYGAFEPPSFPASYFAGEEDYAKFYGGVAENMPMPSSDYKPFIYNVFLSVKNPISLLPLDFMLSYKDFLDYIYVAYGVKAEPNKELLKALNNDLKNKNPMWIYVRRDIGLIEKLKDYGYDALFQLGDIPVFLPDGTVEPDREKHLQEVEYLTFYPNQVKSATVKKSFYFDFFNDIRFKNGGYVCI